MPNSELDELCINTLRFLAVDAVQQADSGHPGMPMGAAPMAYALWDRHLRFDPRDPDWPDRDRFVLSAGHGSMLLYALLHLTGYDLSLDELRDFRQWGSRTPGHPEEHLTPGVEATTGPLGQGIGNAVGMAMAEAALAARFNRDGHVVVDHHTYVIASDGDLMEGVSSEASSLAGHLKLGKLIVLYDDNRVTIDGSTSLAFSEDVLARYDAYGWHTQGVADGNDVDAVSAAIEEARAADRPSLIAVRTHIGYGSPEKQDTSDVHGAPLGPDEVAATKENLGWPTEPAFYIPDDALAHFREAVDRGAGLSGEWRRHYQAYRGAQPKLAAEFERVMAGELPDGWADALPSYGADSGKVATRKVNGAVLNAVADIMPELMGGSADLAPSNKTLIDASPDFSAERREGRNLRFGVREHAMGAISNGLALHGGVRPYAATFLIFSDYMRPPMRLAAMSALPVLYVFTHDSLGVGEDGPTHQPVEQLAGLRSVPGLTVFRPGDANEAVAAWKAALEHTDGPVALVMSRQGLPVLDPETYPAVREGVVRGGYVLADAPHPAIVLVATGSEVSLALATKERLDGEGVEARVVSMPSVERFAAQDASYQDDVLPAGVPILSLEAGRTLGWRPYLGRAHEAVGVDRFGTSAPGNKVLEEYGFNVEHVRQRALEALKHPAPARPHPETAGIAPWKAD